MIVESMNYDEICEELEDFPRVTYLKLQKEINNYVKFYIKRPNIEIKPLIKKIRYKKMDCMVYIMPRIKNGKIVDKRIMIGYYVYVNTDKGISLYTVLYDELTDIPSVEIITAHALRRINERYNIEELSIEKQNTDDLVKTIFALFGLSSRTQKVPNEKYGEFNALVMCKNGVFLSQQKNGITTHNTFLTLKYLKRDQVELYEMAKAMINRPIDEIRIGSYN